MPELAFAHSGGTDSNGCHKNSKTGKRHCHTPKNTSNKKSFNRSQAGTYYNNCSEARAATRTPIRRGEAGYGRHLDRDNDGLACE